MTFEMRSPTPIVFGAGKFNELSQMELPGRSALILTPNDDVVTTLGFLKRLTDQLDSKGITYVEYNGVQPNPVVENVMEAAQMARDNACDFIIGLGGGSVLDAAKATSLMIANEGDYWDYVDGKRAITQPRIPVVTIATTAGTGTEIAPFFVITNEERNEKVGFPKPMRYNTWPVLAVVDPELMRTVPPDFTAYQGFDAFAHCSESYLSKKANPMSNMYSLTAIKSVSSSLPAAIQDGNNLHARTGLAFASICSGVVMSVGSTTSKHSLEHAMSAYHNELPHGAGLLMICRAYYKKLISKQVLNERFITLAKAMGNENAKEPMDFIRTLDDLMHKCGVADLKMSDYGIRREEFPKFIRNARTTAIGYLIDSDSVTLSDEDFLEIYEASYR